MQVWDHHEGSLSKRLAFESLICASFILSIVQGLAQMIPSLEVNGWMISVTKLFVSPVLSLALAFAVSRWRSRIAAVIFLCTVGLAVWLVYLDLVEDYWRNLPFVIGLFSVLADLIAAGLVVRWFARSEL